MINLKERHKETARDFIWRSIQIASKQGTTFIIFFLAARYLTPTDFGILSYLMAIMALLLIFCDFGISTATAKFTAEYKSKSLKELNKILYSTAIAVIAIVSIVSIGILTFGPYLFSKLHTYIIYLIPVLYFTPLTSIIDGVYQGKREFKKSAIISFVIGIISVLLSYLLIKNYEFTGALISQSIFLGLLTGGLLLFQRDIDHKFSSVTLIRIIRYSLYIGLANVAFFLYTKADILVLKQFGFVVEIGYYEIINRIFNLTLLPAVILGTVIGPEVISLMTKKDYYAIRHKLIIYSIGTLIIGILLSLGLFIITPRIIQNLLPEYYSQSFMLILDILLLLLPIKLWGVFCTNGFITPGGYIQIITITTFIGGIVNVVADIILIKILGFTGVFYATLIIHSINIIVASGYFYHRINIKLTTSKRSLIT